MARTTGFNPKAVLVARKSRGLALAGKRYEQGEAIDDDCISFRKRRQLYAQNLVCHPHELDKNSLPAEVKEAEEAKSTKEEDVVNPKADNGDDSDASVATESNTQESEGEASSEPEKKEVEKPVRRRRRKQPSKE